jgi:hypothetical protein
MSQFVVDLATGNYWNGLGQYGVGRASFGGQKVIDTTKYPTPNSQNPNQPFAELQMQNQLKQWLDDGAVTPKPAGDEENLVYLIFAPLDTTLSLGGQTTGFCGYHWHGKYNASTARDNLFWVVMDGKAYKTISNVGQQFVDSISYCVTHELSEVFSNPDGQGYYNDNGCEIGDLCEATPTVGCCITVPYVVSGRTWKVERYWSNVDSKCIIGDTGTTALGGSAAVSATPSPLACFGVNGSNARVYFFDSISHVSELAWQDRFVDTSPDITTQTQANNAGAGSGLACFGVNGSDARVYYLDVNNHLIELAWAGGWQVPATDISAQTGAAPVAGSALACFGVNGSASRVYYLDKNYHVNEVAWHNGWKQPPTDITQQFGAPPAIAGSALACLAVNGTDARVYYFAGGIDVYELQWSNGQWTPNQLTGGGLAGGPSALPAAKNALACFRVDGGNSRAYYLVNNLNFMSNENNVYELAWDNGWGNTQLTGTGGHAGGGPAASATKIACFGVDGSASRVYYLDVNNHLIELAWDNGWLPPTDISAQFRAAPAAGSALTCFGAGGSASRVYYLDKNFHVNEAAWMGNNSWSIKIF